MKNRFLPSGFLTAFLGISFLLFTTLTLAGVPGSGDPLSKIRANQVTGKVDPKDVLKAQQQIQQSRTKAASGLGLNWQFMGPDNYAGPAFTVLFDNNDVTYQTIYTGGTNGGIWRSGNLGLTWHKMNTSSTEELKVSSMIQTTTGTFYVGTGVTTCHVLSYPATGLYRSIDGENFTVVPETALNNDWIAIPKLAVDTRNNRLFAATNGGLFYSDNGDNWTRIMEGYTYDVEVGSDGTVLAVINDAVYIARGGNIANLTLLSTGEEGMLPNTNVGWVQTTIAPSDPNVMYAAVADLAFDLNNIYRSADKGATWSVIFPQNPTFNPYNESGCYANTLVVYPDDPDRLLLGGINMWLGVKHDDGFFYWEEISASYAPSLYYYYVPGYHHDYVFRPGNPQNIAIASDGGITLGTRTTSGFTFQTSNRNLITSHFYSVCPSKSIPWVMGGGYAIGTQTLGYYNPSAVNTDSDGFQIWLRNGAANDGGDGGSCAWSSINPLIGIFSNLLIDVTVEDNVRRRELNDLTYANVFLDSITNTTVPIIPMTMWESFYFENSQDSVKFVNRSDTLIPAGTNLVILSANNFSFVVTSEADIPAGDSIKVVDPVANRLFVSGLNSAKSSHGVFMTKDALKMSQEPSWYMVFKVADDKIDEHITTLSVSKDLNTMWAGSDSGSLYRISNLIMANDFASADVRSPVCIVSNETINVPAIKGRYITSISIDPNNSNNVLITLGNWGNSNYLYYTQNAHDSLPVFTDVTGDFPGIPVFSSLIEIHGSNRAVLGTEYGVYATSNLSSASPAWAPDYLHLGDVPVLQLVQQTADFNTVVLNEGIIYAATDGRGIWMDSTNYIPVGIDPGQEPDYSSDNLMINPNPVRDKAVITWNADKNTSQLMVYDLNGRPVLTGSLGTTAPGMRTVTIDFSVLPSGTYVVRINNAAGKIVKL